MKGKTKSTNGDSMSTTDCSDTENLAAGKSIKDGKKYSHSVNQFITVAGVTMTLFATGTITGFSSVTTYQLTKPGASIKADHEDLSWIASLVTIGMFSGTMTSGVIGDILGRRKTIIVSSLIFFVGWLCIGFANSVGHILVGRILTGMASGMYSTTVQVYICEIVDASIRGVSGSVPTLMVSLGVIVMYTLGSFLEWRVLALCSSVFPLLVFCYMFYLPDSPSWLISKGKYSEAVRSLTWLRDNRDEAEEEVARLTRIQDRRLSRTNPPSPFKKYNHNSFFRSIKHRFHRFTERAVIYPLFLGVMLFFFQKFCGASSITFYATLIFKYAENDINDYVQTVVIGFVKLISTLLSVFLIKFYKRRMLLITSGLMMFASNGILGGYFYLKEVYVHHSGTELENGTLLLHVNSTNSIISSAFHSHALDSIPLICVTTFMIFSSIGFGIIPFFLVVELLPSDVRAIGCSISYGFCQLCQFLAVKTFLNMLDSLNTYGTFWFYAIIAFLGSVFVAVLVPETSNLSQSQIEKLFDRKGDLDTTADNSSCTSNNCSSDSEDEDDEHDIVEEYEQISVPLLSKSSVSFTNYSTVNEKR